MTKYYSTFIITGAVIFLTAIAQSNTNEQIEKYPMLNQFTAGLRSDQIKKLANQRYHDLFNPKVEIAQEAINIFFDLKATSLLEKAMDNRNFQVKLHALSAFRDMVKPGDSAVVELLIRRLEETNVLSTGGSETHIPKHQYQVELVQLLAELTKLRFDNMDVRKSEDIMSIMVRTRQWIELQKIEKSETIELHN